MEWREKKILRVKRIEGGGWPVHFSLGHFLEVGAADGNSWQVEKLAGLRSLLPPLGWFWKSSTRSLVKQWTSESLGRVSRAIQLYESRPRTFDFEA